MSVGFIGTGAIGGAVAALLAATGQTVVVSNSRGPASLQAKAAQLGATVTAGTTKQAAEADVVFVSVPWSHVAAALGAVSDWSGKILVDTTNPLEAPTFRKAELGGRTSSEVVGSHAPGARVVKAFNHLSPVSYADPRPLGGRRLLFMSGDDPTAKSAVLDLIEPTGFVAIDLGGLAEGGRLHEFPGGPLPARNFVELA
ncbi:NADPH-dependent F420 reductase [Microbacterium sp.]|uniref:NADPH-dependent F420 reductase n=1 Tax=Microbacterium sp. TaxID=51671 RepID=UPI003C789AF3